MIAMLVVLRGLFGLLELAAEILCFIAILVLICCVFPDVPFCSYVHERALVFLREYNGFLPVRNLDVPSAALLFCGIGIVLSILVRATRYSEM